jgi:hypothetical protein
MIALKSGCESCGNVSRTIDQSMAAIVTQGDRGRPGRRGRRGKQCAWAAALAVALVGAAFAARGDAEPRPPAPPVELGAVHWLRDYDAAVAQARAAAQPILLLFQEVPG